jgi:16S rRNA (cytosine967-C5)-methyltransferase
MVDDKNTGASPPEIRARAARIVAQVVENGRSLDGVFPANSGSAQERGLTRSLVYGTMRWHIRLSAVLATLSSRPVEELDPELRALILVGLFQLLHTDIASHAVVSETVEAARVLRQPKAAGFVNAILRRCQREAAEVLAAMENAKESSLSIRTSHPLWLTQALAKDWPDKHAAILDANNAHPPMWLRVNSQRSTTEEYLRRLQAAGFVAHVSEFARHAIRLETPTDVRNLPDFAAGFVSVQDAAAQLAAPLLAARSGDRVLDACAAPGGKTCHLLEIAPHIRELTALDLSAARLRKVQENLTRLDLKATIVAGDASDPDAWWDGRPFDRILLDVPCSATGVIRRHPDIKTLRRESDIEELATRQTELLQRLWPLLAPGGRLLYASCSALRAENADIVSVFLRQNGAASDVTAKQLAQCLPSSCSLASYPGPGHAIAAGEAQMDGFYYACLDKNN